ncbi:hypothetical protein DH86_00002516 [Scytalidium sp. 3C]|nr:hypothetical protein DH86_00002516 [Scytalidium sp. 3C]
MASSQLETVSAFVEGAPPGEALTIDTPNLVSQLGPAFEKYNEEQLTTVKLPGSSQYSAHTILLEKEDITMLRVRRVLSSITRNRNGRWRSQYVFDTSSSSLTGSIKVDVHYYEDGNVRLLSTKPVSTSVSSASATTIVREIATVEKKYQEEINKGFTNLSEGAFKGLRRQLPVTRQKIEWDRIAGYRLGQDIGGGSSRR